ncbi:MAG: hypothetical protein AAGD32_03780 [Planctomycetota bacterium]
MRKRGFTLLELLLILGIVVVLLAIVVPYAAAFREGARRVECVDQLRQIRDGLDRYILTNIDYPRVTYAPDSAGYTAFTGTDDAEPFVQGAGEDVQSNDVTASLWLLMRSALVPDPGVFVCPSTWDTADPLTNKDGVRVGPAERGNFRGPGNLSYSYANPFSMAEQFGLKQDNLPGGFALMADMNPGTGVDGIFPVPSDATAGQFAAANSPNHNRAGQNVLYADGSVRWHATPYVGFAYAPAKEEAAAVWGDNIYSTLSIESLPAEHGEPFDLPGFIGQSLAPSHVNDSYLVPTIRDE